MYIKMTYFLLLLLLLLVLTAVGVHVDALLPPSGPLPHLFILISLLTAQHS